MNKQHQVKRSATIHQYYSILASTGATGFSFSNPTTNETPQFERGRCTHLGCVPTTQTISTNTISLNNHYSKQTSSGMSQEEIRKLYDKAWEWFKSPNMHSNPIKM